MSAALTLEEQAGDRLDNDAYELEFGCQELSLGHPLNILKDDIVGRLVFFWKQSIDLLILNSPQRFNCIDDFRVELDNLQLYQSETHLMQIIPFVPLKVEKALCQFTDIDLADSFCVGVVFLRLTQPREYAKPIKPFEYHLGELHSQRQQLLHLATVEDLGFLFGGQVELPDQLRHNELTVLKQVLPSETKELFSFRLKKLFSVDEIVLQIGD